MFSVLPLRLFYVASLSLVSFSQACTFKFPGNSSAATIDISTCSTWSIEGPAIQVLIIDGLNNFPIASFSKLTNLETLVVKSGVILDPITKGAFDGLGNLVALKISVKKPLVFSDDAFEHIPNLLELDLSGNNMVGYPSTALAMLSRLEKLDLSGNGLISLGGHSGPPHLKELLLQDMLIGGLPSGYFKGLSDLEKLDLTKNGIGELKANEFGGNLNLKELVLADNSIGTIDVDAFKGLSKLEKLDLRNAFNRPLPLGIFGKHQVRLTNLYLNGFFQSETNVKQALLFEKTECDASGPKCRCTAVTLAFDPDNPYEVCYEYEGSPACLLGRRLLSDGTFACVLPNSNSTSDPASNSTSDPASNSTSGTVDNADTDEEVSLALPLSPSLVILALGALHWG